MQSRKCDHEKLITHFQLSSRIPKNNFYRRLKETLDLTFLYEHTKDCYGSTGNPSIDPVVFRSGGPVQIHAHWLSREYYV
ncbi:transposase [Spirosoma flavus]